MERSLSLLTDRIEVLRAAVRRARAQHPFQNIPAAEGATLFRPTVMKMCRYLCPLRAKVGMGVKTVRVMAILTPTLAPIEGEGTCGCIPHRGGGNRLL